MNVFSCRNRFSWTILKVHQIGPQTQIRTKASTATMHPWNTFSTFLSVLADASLNDRATLLERELNPDLENQVDKKRLHKTTL